MTDVEKQAAEAAAAKAEADAVAEKEKQQSKTYSEKDFKDVVQQRQELKAKLAAIEDAQKKADEEKKIGDGKINEVLKQREIELETIKKQLEEADKKAKAFEEQQGKIREQAISQLTDDKLKALASKLPGVDDVLEFVKIHTESKVTTFDDKTKKAVGKDGESPFKKLPNESFNQWQDRVAALKMK